MERRLAILFDAGVISAEVYQGMQRVVDKLETQWHFQIRNPQGEMAITHMANALMRAYRNQPVIPMDAELFAEVEQSDQFSQIKQINHQLLSEFSITVPDAEMSYLLANLYGLYLAQQN